MKKTRRKTNSKVKKNKTLKKNIVSIMEINGIITV